MKHMGFLVSFCFNANYVPIGKYCHRREALILPLTYTLGKIMTWDSLGHFMWKCIWKTTQRNLHVI